MVTVKFIYRINEVTRVKKAAAQLMWQQLADVVQNQAANANGVVVFVEVATHEALYLGHFITVYPDVAWH